MKKQINTAFIYSIAAMAGGVFYREFTKFLGFKGYTVLSLVHTHLFLLGMFFFLLVAVADKEWNVTSHRRFSLFYGLYNAGVIITSVMLFCRGLVQALGIVPSPGLNASISGIAGLGHILMGVGIVLFFLILRHQLPAGGKK